MKHFLDVQNGPVFALFLYVFTNFFLVLLIKKAFLRLLLCIFHNRQKMQETYQTLRAICEQRHACNLRTAYTDEHFSQQKSVFLQLPTSSQLASLQNPTSSGRQINSSRRQPANIMPPFFFSYQPSQLQQPTTPKHQPAPTTPATSFLTEQISASRPSATFTFTNFFHLSTSFLFSRNLPQKKLSLRLSFSRCI